MTDEEFKKIRPGKTIIMAHSPEGESKKMLVKFFLCNPDDFDGYWLCCTEDFSNPYPNDITDDDWNIGCDNSDIVSY